MLINVVFAAHLLLMFVRQKNNLTRIFTVSEMQLEARFMISIISVAVGPIKKSQVELICPPEAEFFSWVYADIRI